MLLSARTARRAVAGAVGAGSVAGAMLFGALPAASAQPAPAAPNCTAADLAGVAAGVSASTSAYLFTHPDVNNFFNPVVKGELTSIRQPLVDLKNRCGDTNGDGLADS
jgi:hypothetical protein